MLNICKLDHELLTFQACLFWGNSLLLQVWIIIKKKFIASVTTQLPGANGYTGGKVVFIDTENTLYPLEY